MAKGRKGRSGQAGGAKAGAVNARTADLQERWGAPVDGELLVLALTHRSFANEMGGIPNNERLEFLGDSVLSIIVTDKLYRTYPDVRESELAKMRVAVVSQAPLARAAEGIGLGPFILLGVGESKTGGARKDSILADTFEALIGATYLSSGLEVTTRVVLQHLKSALDQARTEDARYDWKTPLIDLLQPTKRDDVTFHVVGSGPDHDKRYQADVFWEGRKLGSGEGSSKRSAENAAAHAAYVELKAEGSA